MDDDRPGSGQRTPGGVYAAVLTPLTGDLQPDTGLFLDHCRWLLSNGCDGLAPLGTTGEANSLSARQRLALIEAAAAAMPMDRFIWGAGSCALADAVEVTRAVVSAGGAGALLLPPFYYKNPSEDGLFGFFSEVIQRVGDDRLRLYLYHFPQLSAVPLSASLIERLRTAYGATIAGIKDSEGQWPHTAALIEQFRDLAIFSGSEQFLLANLRAGGAGCISATVNISAPLAREVYLQWRTERGAAAQEALTEIRLIVQGYPMQAGLKYLVGAMSGNPAWRNILPPNRPLSAAQADELTARLRALPVNTLIFRALPARGAPAQFD